MNFNKKSYLKIATLKNTLLVSIVWLTVALFILPEAKRQNQLCANGAIGIDQIFTGNPDEAYDLLQKYGEEGRFHYVVIELTAGIFHSISLSVLLCFLLLWSANISPEKKLKTIFILRVSLLILSVNIIKNMGMAWVLLEYPEKNYLLFYLTSFIFYSKVFITLVALGIIVWNLALFGIKKQASITSLKREKQNIQKKHPPLF